MIWTKLTKIVPDELKKSLKKWPTDGRPKVSQNHEIDEKVDDFFFFFEFAGYCFGGLGPNHVSKFQVRTRKNERSTAILACFERLGRPSLYKEVFRALNG